MADSRHLEKKMT